MTVADDASVVVCGRERMLNVFTPNGDACLCVEVVVLSLKLCLACIDRSTSIFGDSTCIMQEEVGKPLGSRFSLTLRFGGSVSVIFATLCNQCMYYSGLIL